MERKKESIECRGGTDRGRLGGCSFCSARFFPSNISLTTGHSSDTTYFTLKTCTSTRDCVLQLCFVNILK